MFGRKGNGQDDTAAMHEVVPQPKAELAPYGSPARAESAPVARPPAMAAARRVIDIPARRSSYAEGGSVPPDARRLTVGREITLTGEIATCDVLVVEGHVSATLRDGRMIEITEAGMFQGTVEIDNADIAGKFEGDLIVHNRLTIRATGRIAGRVQYGELEVMAGGQITGEIQAVTQAMAQAPSFRDPSKMNEAYDDDTMGSTQDMLGKGKESRAV
jgi:cytoskeletal protein CcmA (bactofilin family)